jgi:hypothetical protein
VIVPGGNTGMGPEKTQFFQALNIQTKITKGVFVFAGGLTGSASAGSTF